MRLSGLQKEVLSLYRSCLRESRKKPKVARPHFEAFARSEFDRNIKIDKRDFSAIEFLLRKGRRQLDVYSAPVHVIMAHIAPNGILRLQVKPGNNNGCGPGWKVSSPGLGPCSVSGFSNTGVQLSYSIIFWLLGTLFGIETMPTPNLPYKGSPHRRPKPNYPSPPVAKGIRPQRLTHETSQPYLPQSSTTAPPQRQRRISRNQHGLRVSRRLPTRTSRGSLPAADSQSPLSQAPQSPSHPYWGALQSPSKSDKTSRVGRADNHTTNTRSKEIANTGPARDKMLSGTESTNAKRQGGKTPKREKRFGVADPLAWDVLNRSLSQQRRLSSLISQDGPIAMPANRSSKKTPDGVSRTSSQRRALNRFARELEKYADVAGTVVPVITPTISESKVSLHTVKPLVPYKDEFLAAGLAVTSTEQTRNGKTHAHVSTQDNRPHEHLNGPLQTRKKIDPPVDGPLSGASASTPCTSLESYVEFSPPSGHMLHAIDSLVPRKPTTKSRHCQHTRRRLLSWFLKKPSSKVCTANGHHLPVRIQHVKGGQIKPRDPSVNHHEHHGIQHKSHRTALQSVPEIQLWPRAALPPKYVTPKKEPYVALIKDYYEPKDPGHHLEQEGGHSHSLVGAKKSLDRFGLQGKRDITRGVLPQPYPEPIETIDEETEISTHPVGNNIQTQRPDRLNQKELPGITQCARQRPDAVSLVTHESSVPSLPFAARLAVSTSSSLQRALDDACQKLDNEECKRRNLSERENTKPELPPLPQQDSRHSASHHALPRKPRSTEKFIYVKRSMPTVESLPLTSKPLPPEPVPATQATPKKRSDPKPSQPTRKAPPPPTPAPRALTGKRKNAVAELAKAEEMLKDLDVFLNDYDDANIEDRDVIKGLQVAIHAAADDLYDGYIRHKTGLRIRRFLADLKSFEDISELSSTEQRAREKTTKGIRPEGFRGENK
ncbi:hypothetical protein O1611_g7928 [Lasiodiplodia mahajangana]|uniref:Uncharacterized protein n=1 Tax=Lasiodiplodia mahajangana TaxID=1108764 RepID=A0ACC2JE61_9PEZI|nr:hypothetical protein O1611_g7928 [Lasiodiplodia mahajangana]